MDSRPMLASHDSDDEDGSTPRAGGGGSAGGGRMQELLASYYGMHRGADRSSDIESTTFDAKAYVRGLLKNEKVETLLRKDDEMVREVKKLDSDMQMLVYENYNKFISATDTIRKMAQNVEGMETEMADLGSSMDRISESSATVNKALERNRSKMDKLVRVRRLLQRLDFLFQLPQKLEEAVQEGQYAKAIRFFAMTKDILRKHSHVSSFGAIQKDCEDTVRRLQDKLQEEVNNPDVSRDTLVSHADLLLKMGVDPAGLKERYLEAHRRQLHGFLSASKGALVEDRSVSLDACLGKLAEGFLPMLLRMVQMYCQLFQQKHDDAATRSQGGGARPPSSFASTHKENGEQNGEEAGPTPITNTAPIASAAPPRNGQSSRKTAASAGGGAIGAALEEGGEQADLVALAQSSVDGFFKLLQAKVDHSLNAKQRPRGESVASEVSTRAGEEMKPGGSASGGGAARAGAGEDDDRLDAVALGGVVAAVQQLVSDMEAVDPHVPQVVLARRAKEFAQEFKRSQVRRSFRVLCRSSLAVANFLVNGVRAGTNPEDMLLELPGAPPGGGAGGVGGMAGSRSSFVSGGRRRRLGGGAGGARSAEGQQYQALVERALDTFLTSTDAVVAGARPLSRLDSSPRPLAEELRYGLWGVVLWLAASFRILAGVTPDATVEALPSAESREYEAHLEEEWGARAVAALGEPLPSSQDLNKGLAVPSSGDDKGSVEDDGEGEEGDGGRDGVGGGAAGGSTEGEVVLLLACLCRGLGTNFVVCVPEILGRQLPPTLDQSVHAPPPHFSSSIHSVRSASSTLHSGYTDRDFDGDDESPGGASGVIERRRQADAVRNRVSVASLSILESYAETTGRRLADVLQGGLDAPPGGGDWFSVDEPRGVGEAVLDALELAEDSVKEVCAFLGEARTGTVSVTRAGDRDFRRGNVSLGGRNGSSVGGVRRDIDRIFAGGGGTSSRGPHSGPAQVSFAADAMLAAVFRVALKAFGERARFLTLPGPGFRQVQLDADFLRQVLPYYVAESQMLSSLDRLLDQALQSAADRSLDPTPMDPATAGDIVAQALDGFT